MLERINPEENPKKIAAELGLIISYILSRVLKLDKKYVEFYKENPRLRRKNFSSSATSCGNVKRNS
jgi:hypothetical protein